MVPTRGVIIRTLYDRTAATFSTVLSLVATKIWVNGFVHRTSLPMT
jgi:hypothetical protein